MYNFFFDEFCSFLVSPAGLRRKGTPDGHHIRTRNIVMYVYKRNGLLFFVVRCRT